MNTQTGKRRGRGNPKKINFFAGLARRAFGNVGFRTAAVRLGREAVIKEALKLSVADVRNQNLATTGALLGRLMAIAMTINSRQSAELFALLVALFARARAIVESKAKVYTDPEPEPSSTVPETETDDEDEDLTQDPPAAIVPETDESDDDLPEPKPKPKEPVRSVANILAEMPLLSQEPGGFTLNPDNNALSEDDEDKAPPLPSSPMDTQEFINAFLPNKV